ncbi:hypothetical protein BGW39_007860 [Mortierella sp. 14UC]|nr:hypothetical protein BGW39_007860 [Mortierella sp. 14UC]
MLHELLLKQGSAHKSHFGHQVLNFSESKEYDSITIHLSDNNTHRGDIVVGVDGAYSAIRQRMFEQLKVTGEPPKSDHEEPSFSLDFTLSTAQNSICFIKIHHISEKSSMAVMEQRFRDNENSEWGVHPAQTIADKTRNLPIKLDDGEEHTLGDLYELTPGEFISKVMFEERVFKTWYHDRVVTGFHYAVALANLIYAIPTTSSKDITQIFQEYQQERYPAVMESFKNSQPSSKLIERGLSL